MHAAMQRGEFVDTRFEIEDLAGAGGMGKVYRARDRATGNLVAIKLLHNTDASHTARFMREIHALSSVAHEHVVQYITHGVTDENEPYLVMEWLEGESLDDRLALEPLTLAEALELARRVAEALGAAHARGIVHRDIKPSNLFLVDGDVARVKVLDFGIAQFIEDTLTLTLTNQVLGTAGYMAPEQARGELGRVDARSDVFSLGCVLFECLTGRPAFEGAHLMALLAKLLLDQPPRVRALAPDVPAAVDALVATMLDRNPTVRPVNGTAVAHTLAVLAGGADAANAEAPPVTASSSGAERCLVSARNATVETGQVWLTAERPDALVAEATCALVGARFEVAPAHAYGLLQGEVEREAMTRILLRAPSRLAGRERELRHLMELLAGGSGEPRPGALLVTAAAGMGKSRLDHEMIRAPGTRHDDMLLAVARSDSNSADSGIVFGHPLILSGALSLLGKGVGTARTWRELLADLHRRELVIPVQPSEVRRAEDEYAFRHALFREAAYAVPAGRNRVAGHRRAWLRSAEQQDARVLAEHVDQNGEDAPAASFHHRAALQALREHDLAAVESHVQRGLALGPDAPIRGGLHAIQAAACFWRGDHAASYERARQALDLVAPGTKAHWLALSMAIVSAGYTGQHEAFTSLVASLLEAEPAPDTDMSVELDRFMLDAFWGAFAALIASGLVSQAERCLRCLERIVIPRREREPFAAACLETAYAYWHRYAERAPWAALGHGRATLALYERAGEPGSRDLQQALIVACELMELGAFAEAEEIVAQWPHGGAPSSFAGMWATYARAMVYACTNRLDEALALATATEAQACAQGNHVLAVRLRYIMIDCSLQCGELAEAEQMLLGMGEPRTLRIVDRPEFLATLARIRLAQGRHREAARLAGEALAADDAARIGIYSIRDTCRLVRAEALHAMGEVIAATETIRAAHDDLLARAARIEEPAGRLRFLHDVPWHARVLDLARDWL